MKQKRPLSIKDEGLSFVLPPFFTDSSHCLPHQVRSERTPFKKEIIQMILLRANGRVFRCSLLCHPSANGRPANSLAAPNGMDRISFQCTTPGCIRIVFPCASHRPAALCRCRSIVLFPINVFAVLCCASCRIASGRTALTVDTLAQALLCCQDFLSLSSLLFKRPVL